jgi:hypothetical protein
MTEEKKYKCFWCGREIDLKYYATIQLKEEITIENFTQVLDTKYVFVCLKCYFEGFYKKKYVSPRSDC